MNKLKLPSNEVILYILAIAGALNFMYALTALDGASILSLAGVLSLLRGLVTGAVAGLAMAKISHAIPRASKTNRPYIIAAFVTFLVATLPLVSVVTFARMSAEMLLLPLWVRVTVAIAAGLLLDALTAGVAFASGKLEADDRADVAKVSEPKAEKAPALQYVCSHCGRAHRSQNALNAHIRIHKVEVK